MRCRSAHTGDLEWYLLMEQLGSRAEHFCKGTERLPIRYGTP